ncbi:hypothetical protein CEXT_256111 [Caerostris extrusa]|uniref:Uncharacterized protein n=1 Tax=Caerostris extrusa TaxID=172846 RepID=A0AAV4SP88_CAEEX|nr:hypothetical protein CEXT_256111 [Caerostris extrusa]
MIFRIFNYAPLGTRTSYQPKLRWTDCVEAGLNILRVTNWKTGLYWKKVLGKALPHSSHHGLSSQWKKKCSVLSGFNCIVENTVELV